MFALGRTLTIGYVLAGRGNAKRPLIKQIFSLPFTAPLVLRTLAAMVSEVAPSVQHLGWDELLRGEITDKFLRQVDLVFLSGLTTATYGMQRIAMLAKTLNIPVVAGGSAVTCRYYGNPKENLPELLSYYDAVCIGRATPRIIGGIIEDFSAGELKPMYVEQKGEPISYPTPDHRLFRGRYLFDNVIQSSTGCSSACNFCVVHRCLPEGKRGRIYCVPKEVIAKQLEVFAACGGGLFFDGADSFGEDADHTFETVLPLYAEYAHPQRKWMTEAKISTLKGEDGNWQLLKAMAKAGNIMTYAGFEDLFNKFTSKQVGLSDIEEFIKVCRGEGIMPVGSLILDGAPTAFKDDIRRTIDWICHHKVDVQFSLSSALESSVLWSEAVRNRALIDVNPEHTDGAWPQVLHPNMSPEFLIKSLAQCYKECYSLSEIFSRLCTRGFSCNSILAALAGVGVHVSAKSWFKHHNYLYWLSHKIDPNSSHQ